jgi:hypothetical protein
MTSVTAHAAKSLTEHAVLRFAHAFGQGLLWVLEQIPGHITTGDQTEFLTTKVRTRNEKPVLGDAATTIYQDRLFQKQTPFCLRLTDVH